jgi:aminopeptidase
MFQPSQQILRNYALILIDFALGKGKGIKHNDVVRLEFDAPALPLALEVYRRILEKGGHPIVHMVDDSFSRLFYTHAQEHQLTFFPKSFTRAIVKTIDHRIYLMAPKDPLYLKTVDPKKIIKSNRAKQLYRQWLFHKEDQGKLTWTVALFGTEGLAKEAGISIDTYWEQIINANFLSKEDPIKIWKNVFSQIEAVRIKLNSMEIDSFHILARHTDLKIKLGEKRQFIGGGGANIPSFEIFTSPDWRGVEGKVFFDFPLYRYGNIIRNIQLKFNNGRIVKATAEHNNNLLQELIKQPNADRIGEFSLTDRRFSHIRKFMANTLYDENFGGAHGNMHLAVGSSYHDTYDGKVLGMKKKDWKALGFNESPEHTDIIATANRTIETVLKNGIKKSIYKDGRFVL